MSSSDIRDAVGELKYATDRTLQKMINMLEGNNKEGVSQNKLSPTQIEELAAKQK